MLTHLVTGWTRRVNSAARFTRIIKTPRAPQALLSRPFRLSAWVESKLAQPLH